MTVRSSKVPPRMRVRSDISWSRPEVPAVGAASAVVWRPMPAEPPLPVALPDPWNADNEASWRTIFRVVQPEESKVRTFLGVTLAGQMNFFSPELVIVGGGVVEALGEPYLKIVRESAQPHLLADPQGAKRIVIAERGDDSAVLGAALMAREVFAPDSVYLPPM